MQFPLSWLRGLVDPGLDSAALGHLLTMAGLEVEADQAAAPVFNDVVVAEILSAARHPDADRLQVCTVAVGAGEPLQIVCGAPNARAGLKTACALVGAVLPGEFQIKRAKVRGVESAGMLCSAKELGIVHLFGEEDGILELPAAAVVGQPLRAALDLDDRLVTLKLTPNRGDCLSLRGIAREVAAITGAPLGDVDCAPVAASLADVRRIEIEAPAACPRYLGRVIRGIDPAARTPDWLRQRLARAGLRSLHPVVDVTNYVLLELGEPMHAFDLARLDGDIRVRLARPGEPLVLLNGDEIKLDADALVIADARQPLALAGIMGGAASAVSATTTDIFLEAAHFTPAALAGRARRFGLATDASHRFERGVDPALPELAMARATRLILDICGGSAGPVSLAGDAPAAPAAIAFRPARARRLLGVEITDAEMRARLERLGLAVAAAGDTWQVTPPGHRFDLAIEVDLVEEIARLGGYHAIPARLPRAAVQMKPAPEHARDRDAVADRLTALGYQEVITYSFIDEAAQRGLDPNAPITRLLNPIASQMSVMRASLWPGLLGALRHNLNHGQEDLRLFEIGRCFLGAGAEQQPLRLAGLAHGAVRPEQWGEASRLLDFFDVKGELEALLQPLVANYVGADHPALHPGQCARLELDGVAVGWLGALHPAQVRAQGLARAPILFELDWAAAAGRRPPRYRSLSRQPAVRRDLAVLVDADLRVGDILAAVNAALPARVSDFALFDLYQGKGVAEGKKSLAFRMLLQDTEKTLTDAEIEAAVAEVLQFLAARFNATLRIQGVT